MISNTFNLENQIENPRFQSLAFLLGFFLNTTSVISGINFSISDFFIIIAFISLVTNRKLLFNKSLFLAIIALIVYRLLISVIIIPISFSSINMTTKIFVNLIKFAVNILYLVCIYSISCVNSEIFIKFSKGLIVGAFFSSIVGIATYLIAKNSYLFNFMFMSGLRLRGFMNDPNYFAFMQVVSFFLSNFIFKNTVKKMIKVVLFFGVILSASKTAIILLIFLVLWNHKGYLKKHISILKFLFLFPVIVLVLYTILHNSYEIISYLERISPQFSRISSLLTEPSNALNQDGSTRVDSWETAVKLFLNSYTFGIGFLDYTEISTKLYNVKTIAHNTYFQLFVEWGFVFTVLFLTYLGKCVYTLKKSKETMLIQVIFIFLLFSLAISLQNARLFWIVLGVVFARIAKKQIIL